MAFHRFGRSSALPPDPKLFPVRSVKFLTCGPCLYIHGEERYYSIVFFLTAAPVVVVLLRSPGSSFLVPSVQVSPPRGFPDLSASNTAVPGRLMYLPPFLFEACVKD